MSMPKKQINIPRFRTEAEEIERWDSHPEAATEIMKRAIKSGKARRPRDLAQQKTPFGLMAVT
jgi:hypothetical protein